MKKQLLADLVANLGMWRLPQSLDLGAMEIKQWRLAEDKTNGCQVGKGLDRSRPLGYIIINNCAAHTI